MSDDPPPPDFTVTSEVPHNGTSVIPSNPQPPRHPSDEAAPGAVGPPPASPGSGGLFDHGPVLGLDDGALADHDPIQDPVQALAVPPVPIMLEGSVRSYDEDPGPDKAFTRVRTLVATGQDHVESLYRRQAAVAGAVLVVLAVVGALTFPRSWGDHDPGLPVEAGPGEPDDPATGGSTLNGVIEPVTSDVGIPAAPTTQQLSARLVARSREAAVSRPAGPAGGDGSGEEPPATTIPVAGVNGGETSATVGICGDPLPVVGCISKAPTVTEPATTGPSATVGPIEEFPVTTVVGRVVTTVPPAPTKPVITKKPTATTEKPTATTIEPATTEKPTTTIEPASTEKPTTTLDPATTSPTVTTETTAPIGVTTAPPASTDPVESPTPPTKVSDCTPGASTVC